MSGEICGIRRFCSTVTSPGKLRNRKNCSKNIWKRLYGGADFLSEAVVGVCFEQKFLFFCGFRRKVKRCWSVNSGHPILVFSLIVIVFSSEVNLTEEAEKSREQDWEIRIERWGAMATKRHKRHKKTVFSERKRWSCDAESAGAEGKPALRPAFAKASAFAFQRILLTFFEAG